MKNSAVTVDGAVKGVRKGRSRSGGQGWRALGGDDNSDYEELVSVRLRGGG